jgi:hypothetical protein
MVRRSTRRRPVLELLGAGVLLSESSVIRSGGLAALTATGSREKAAVELHGGAINGSCHGGKGPGSPLNLNGRGVVQSLGLTSLSFQGTLQLGAASPEGSDVLSTKGGRITTVFAAARQPISGPTAFGPKGVEVPLNYTITGGSGKWAGASSSGIAVM